MSESELQTLKTIEKCKETVSSAQRRVDEKLKHLSSDGSKTEEKIPLSAQISELIQENRILNQELEKLKASFSESTQWYSSQLDSLKLSIQSLEAQKESLIKENTSLKTDMKSLSENSDTLDIQVKKLSKFEQIIAQGKEKLSSLQEIIDESQRSEMELKQEVLRLKDTIERGKQQFIQVTSELSDLREEHELKVTECKSLSFSNKKHLHHIQSLSKALASAGVLSLKGYKECEDELSLQIVMITKTYVERLQKEEGMFKAEIALRDAKIDTLQKQNDSLRVHLFKIVRTIDEMDQIDFQSELGELVDKFGSFLK
ncbi:hypothetical protein ADUPG1_013548 [Aduncisulcus paluster]|uniref:Uncharacterized protein n=1 Tax=Aduncisulcus paluster TaxID=2918883 RepID=A0ABQ5K3E1_9EUKA|nr:hypothetical protein ADUPG1_013548 [Aduncisulcus paluster]